MAANAPAQALGDAVRRLMPRPPVTRFAPSPTGYLHIGHVVNAVYVWGLAGATGGHVHLRIEDHDRGRCRQAYVDACLEDLAWLGFVPDSGLAPLDRQTSREGRYSQVLDHLIGSNRAYACTCSRRELGNGRYDGRCRARKETPRPNEGARVVLDDVEEAALDVLAGPLRQRPAQQCGDLLVRERAGHWTYQFAVTVDDMDQGITLVVRGADLLDSTGRQVALARLIGRTAAPLFLHHPLVMAPDDTKLSKSDGATGVRELRAAGLSASEVIGAAAARVGLAQPGMAIGATEVAKLFGRSGLG